MTTAIMRLMLVTGLMLVTAFLELFLLLGREHREDFVLGTHTQHRHLTFRFGRCISQRFHTALIVLIRLVEVVECLVGFA
jgi:hypothetical protein